MTDESQPTASEPEITAAVTEPTEGDKPLGEEEELKKLTQTVEMRDIGPCKKYIKVAVDRQNIDVMLDKKYSELVTDANVAGFRPGKAPRKIIERRFHKDVTDQVKAEVLLQSLEQLAEEHDVAPLSAPNLDPAKIEIPKDGPMVYEFEVEVRPNFDLPNYKGLHLRRPVKTFTDEEVVEEERKLLIPYGQLMPKPEGDTQLGDYLITDLATRAGDQLLSDLKEVKVRVENRLVFKDGVAEKFFEQVKGASAGDTRTVDITLSDSVADESLRGRTVQATLTVKDVKKMKLPELTHEFLHTFGVHNPDQLRERVRVLLNWRLEYAQRQSARQQVLEHISAAAQWQLPQDLLARQVRKALARRVMEMRSSGMAEDEIRARQRLLQQDTLRNTELALKELFVLQKIAEVEKLDADEDDIDAEIDRIADRTGETPRRVRARLEKEDMLDSLAAEIVERKALDLILDSAEYEDEPIGGKSEESVSSVEEQAVPGEMKDLTEPPPAEAPAEATTEAGREEK